MRKHDPLIVSRAMRAVRSPDTSPEVAIRSELRRRAPQESSTSWTASTRGSRSAVILSR